MAELRPVELESSTIDAQIAENLLLGQLDPGARALVRAEVEPLFCPGGEFLVHQGDPADAIFLVTGGRLQVLATRSDGTEARIGEIGRHEVVGEMALITREPRTASVQAVRDTHVLRLSGDAFTRLVTEHPDVLRRVGGTIVARYIRTFRTNTTSSPVHTIAVVALDDGATRAFAASLVEALGTNGEDVVRLDAESVAAELGDGEKPDLHHLAQLIDRAESQHDLLVYDTDSTDPEWAELCVRQADLVLLVADATSSPAVRALEQRLVDVQGTRRAELVLVHPADTRIPQGTHRWLRARDVNRHHHVREGRRTDVERVARLATGRGIAVVLSGGGARGFAHLGVIRALEELGIPVDAIGGTSMGSLIAVAAAFGLDADARVAGLREVVVEGRSALDLTFPAVALASGKRVTESLRTFFGDAQIDDLWINCFCVSCNLTQGEVVVHRNGPIWRAVRASVAIPGVFPPLRDGNDLLVDGGVLDNLPVGRMRQLHEGAYVVAVDVSNKRDLVAGGLPDTGVVSGWRALAERLNPFRARTDTVGIAKILVRLTELSSAFGSEADLADLVLRPPIQAYGAMDFRRSLDGLEALGHDYATAELEQWAASDEPPAALLRDTPKPVAVEDR